MVELLSLTVYTFTFICTHGFVFKSEIRLKSPKSQNSMSSSRKHELVFKSEIRLKAREAKFEVFEPKGEPKSQNSRSSKSRNSRYSSRRASLRLEDLEFWLFGLFNRISDFNISSCDLQQWILGCPNNRSFLFALALI